MLTHELLQLEAYPDRAGTWWLGARSHGKAAGWRVIQPVLGPLAPGGLRFSLHDASGAPVATARAAQRVEVVAVAQPPGPLAILRDSVRLGIALRNNPRP